jgi:hypothetical protein
MKHKDQLENYGGTLEDLATNVTDLRYDLLNEFLYHLKYGIEKDSEADNDRCRPQLADALYQTYLNLEKANYFMNKAYYMGESHDSLPERQDNINGYNKSLKELANSLKNLRYDSLSEYLKQLSKGIKNDANTHRSGKRYKLAAHLYDTSQHLKQAKKQIDVAWKICKPYMKEK